MNDKADETSKKHNEKYNFVEAVNNRSRNFEGRDSEFSRWAEKKFDQNQREKISEIKGSGLTAQIESFKQEIKGAISKMYSKTNQPSLVLLEHLEVLIRGGGEALDYDTDGKASKIQSTPETEKLRLKATDLYAETMDIGKSISRGYRDKMRGDNLFTEMSQKIRRELIEPLAEHYNKNEGKTAIPKEEAFFKLAVLEKNLVAGEKTFEK